MVGGAKQIRIQSPSSSSSSSSSRKACCSGGSGVTASRRSEQTHRDERKAHPRGKADGGDKGNAAPAGGGKALSVGLYLAASSASVALQYAAPATTASTSALACAPQSSTSAEADLASDFPAYLASGGEWSQNRYKEIVEHYSRRVDHFKTRRDDAGAKPNKAAAVAGARAESSPKAASQRQAKPSAAATRQPFSVGGIVRYKSDAMGTSFRTKIVQTQERRSGRTYKLETIDGGVTFKNVKESEISLLLTDRVAQYAVFARDCATSAAGAAVGAAAASATKVAAFLLWFIETSKNFISFAFGEVAQRAAVVWQAGKNNLAEFDFTLSESLAGAATAMTSLMSGACAKIGAAFAAATAYVSGLDFPKVSEWKAPEFSAQWQILSTKAAGMREGAAAFLAGIKLPTVTMPNFSEIFASATTALRKVPAGAWAAIGVVTFIGLIKIWTRGAGESDGETKTLKYDALSPEARSDGGSGSALTDAGAPAAPPKVVPSKRAAARADAVAPPKEKKEVDANPLLVLGAAVSLGADAVGSAIKEAKAPGGTVKVGGAEDTGLEDVVTNTRKGLKSLGKDMMAASRSFDESMAKGGKSLQSTIRAIPGFESDEEEEKEEEETLEAMAALTETNVKEAEAWIENWKARARAFDDAVAEMKAVTADGDQDQVNALFAKFEGKIPYFRERMEALMMKEQAAEEKAKEVAQAAAMAAEEAAQVAKEAGELTESVEKVKADLTPKPEPEPELRSDDVEEAVGWIARWRATDPRERAPGAATPASPGVALGASEAKPVGGIEQKEFAKLLDFGCLASKLDPVIGLKSWLKGSKEK